MLIFDPKETEKVLFKEDFCVIFGDEKFNKWV
jgi:hypothetical protein